MNKKVLTIFLIFSLISGPYFRYTTYLDHLYKPYHKYANLKDAVAKRIYLLPFIASVYFILNYYWPLSVSMYNENSEFTLFLVQNFSMFLHQNFMRGHSSTDIGIYFPHSLSFE